MGKLWVRVALLSTFSIVLTALLVMLIQNFYEARAFQNLNPALRDVTETLQAQPDLTEAQQLELFRTALRRTADSDAEVRQFGQLLRDRLTAQRRIPRLAALLSLPVAVLVSAVLAWFIARPIRNVTRAATRVAHGDLSARAPLPSELQAGSELAKLSHNFNAMAETLQRLDSERKNMVADVAHELRTPLTILQGQIDALREGVRPLNDAALAKLDRQTQLLSRLVQDLRTLSAAEAEGLPLELHTLDIVRFSKGVVSRFEDKANAKGQDLSFHAKLRQNVFVKADPDRLEQVLGNLLENAVRYTPEGGAVDVLVEQQGNSVVIEVNDSGPGLPEEALRCVFDRFYRVDSSRGRALGGSGLGLAISRALVTLHGGSIEVANRASGGATFRVVLPLRLDSRT